MKLKTDRFVVCFQRGDQFVNVLILLVFVEDFSDLHVAQIDQLIQIGSLRFVNGIGTASKQSEARIKDDNDRKE